MKRRALGSLLVTALLLGAGIIAAACGEGGEEPSLKEYFQQLETISNELEERGVAVERELETAFDPEGGIDAAIDALQGLLTEGVSAFEDAFADIERLEPPSGVENIHRVFVEEARGRAELIETLADQIAEVESLSDLEEIFAQLESPEFQAADRRFRDACQVLQGIATDNGIDVDLDCGG
jgi:hypothetical protein